MPLLGESGAKYFSILTTAAAYILRIQASDSDEALRQLALSPTPCLGETSVEK
jgi:hypothetical protein